MAKIPQMSRYRIGDLIVYDVTYQTTDGSIKRKTRPLILISAANSQGDLLGVVGTTQICRWIEEPHILVGQQTVVNGRLDHDTIFPASRQLLINQAYIKGKIGNIPRNPLDKLMRLSCSMRVAAYYDGVHRPLLEASFVPGKSHIPYAGRIYDEKEMLNLMDASLDFWLTAGRYARELEERLAAFLGVKHCTLTNSGSSANLLAFMALTSPELGERRIRRGDEVITMAAGFPTTVAPLIQYGAVPVFVDVELARGNIDCTQLKEALSEKTRAIMLAHTLGNPFDLQAVKTFCDKHGLWLIEDNCDALGAKYFIDGVWNYTGTLGNLATLSFYPPHHMTMGEGGAVVTNNAILKRLVESYRDWGRDCRCPPGKDNTCANRFNRKFGELPLGYDHKYVYSHFGYNLKLTDMQAAIGCAQLEKLPGFIKTRKKNWQALRDGLASLEHCFILPEATPHSDPSWFGFLLTVRRGAPFTREQIVKHLESNGIQTRMLFAGNLTKHPCFEEMRVIRSGYRIVGALKNTDTIMERSFWIGIYPGITTAMIDYILEQLQGFVRQR